MKQAKRYYTAGNGKTYPLFEAPYQYAVTTFKKDCKKAVTGNPEQCLIALGALRNSLIEAAYVGSGKDAYLCFKKTKLREAYALHFTINARTAKVRDYFDTHKGVASKQVILSPPTAGRTLEHRAKLNKRRALEVKNGAEIKKQTKSKETRVGRIGVPHRPRAHIENNVVSMPQKQESAA